jgi:hypothetical protein
MASLFVEGSLVALGGSVLFARRMHREARAFEAVGAAGIA